MKIICIGRNYRDHIKEMENDIPEEPVFFLKPDTALIAGNLPFFIPDFSNDIQYEVEIVLKISKAGRHIQRKFAMSYVSEIGIGIDFTARDVQKACIAKGLPWEKSKAFDCSAPVGGFISLSEIQNTKNINFSLEKNNIIVQRGNTSDLIFDFEEIICSVSKYITLKIGDLIFTGTPSGVGKVEKNDILKAKIEDKNALLLKIK